MTSEKRQPLVTALKSGSQANRVRSAAKQKALRKALYAACDLCDRVMPFDRWMKRARPDQLAYAKLIGGTVESGYALMSLETLHFALYLKVQIDKEIANAAC